MISEKEYFNLIRHRPQVVCPARITEQIQREVSVFTRIKPGKRKAFFSETICGLGSVTILLIFLIMGIWERDEGFDYHVQLAANSQLVIRQMADMIVLHRLKK